MGNDRILAMIEALAQAIEMLADGETALPREIARDVILDIQAESGDDDGEV